MSKNLEAVSGAVPKPVSPMARSKQVTQGLLAAAIVIFLAGAGSGYLILSKIQAAQRETVAREAEAGSSQQIASRYQTTVDNYTQTASQLSFLEASVSQQAFIPTLLQQLQSLATSTQLTVTSVRPMPVPAAPAAAAATAGAADAPVKKAAPLPYTILPITVTVSGTYPQLMRFVYSLPHFPKILSLHSVSLRPDGSAAPGAAASAEPRLTADVMLDAYVFNADPAAATAAAALSVKPGSFSGMRQAQDDVMAQPATPAPGAATGPAPAAQQTAPLTGTVNHAPSPAAAPVAPAGGSQKGATR